jgi:hypothetical protein
MPTEPQSCYPEDVEALHDMLTEQVELLAILEAKRAEGKRAVSVVWAVVRCQSRIGALRAAIEVMGGAL